jgi:hypothetical protein
MTTNRFRERIAAWKAAREREKARPTPASAPPTSGIDTSAHQFETRVASPTATAAAIIAAGRRRRGETDNTASTPSGIAGEIIRAGQRVRGELDDTISDR